MCYLVAKDINKQGCYALKTRLGERLAKFSSELDKSLPHDGIQIVTISRPTAYGEYAPYTFVNDEEAFRKAVMNM